MSAISALLAAASLILEERQELIYSIPIWHCHLYSSATANGHSSFQPDTFCTPHTSVIKLTLESRYVSSWRKKLKKTAKCFAALRSNTVPVRRKISRKGFHQKCSTSPKASNHDDQWKCEKCTKLQQNRLVAPTNCQLPGPTISTPSQPLPVAFWNKFKIYQGNADGICPKFIELRDQLINSNIDILPVQESKLQKTDKTSFI